MKVVSGFLRDFAEGMYCGELLVGPSWFILSLIWMKIILFVLLKKWRSFTSLGIIGLAWVAVLALLSVCKMDIPNYFHFGSALMGFPFYLGGYLMKLKYAELKNRLRKVRWMTVVIVALWVAGFSVNGFTSLEGCVVGRNILLMYLTGLSGTLALVIFTHMFKEGNKWIYVLSCGTIVILCTHGFLLNMTVNKYPVFELYSWEWHLFSMAGCVMLMLVEIPIILLCSRYFKWAMGGRKIVLS